MLIEDAVKHLKKTGGILRYLTDPKITINIVRVHSTPNTTQLKSLIMNNKVHPLISKIYQKSCPISHKNSSNYHPSFLQLILNDGTFYRRKQDDVEFTMLQTIGIIKILLYILYDVYVNLIMPFI